MRLRQFTFAYSNDTQSLHGKFYCNSVVLRQQSHCHLQATRTVSGSKESKLGMLPRCCWIVLISPRLRIISYFSERSQWKRKCKSLSVGNTVCHSACGALRLPRNGLDPCNPLLKFWMLLYWPLQANPFRVSLVQCKLWACSNRLQRCPGRATCCLYCWHWLLQPFEQVTCRLYTLDSARRLRPSWVTSLITWELLYVREDFCDRHWAFASLRTLHHRFKLISSPKTQIESQPLSQSIRHQNFNQATCSLISTVH